MTQFKQKLNIVLPLSMLVLGLCAGYFIAQYNTNQKHQEEMAIIQESISENGKELRAQEILLKVRQDKIALLREMLAESAAETALASTP